MAKSTPIKAGWFQQVRSPTLAAKTKTQQGWGTQDRGLDKTAAKPMPFKINEFYRILQGLHQCAGASRTRFAVLPAETVTCCPGFAIAAIAAELRYSRRTGESKK